MSKPYPEGTVFVSTTTGGGKGPDDPNAGAGYAPVYVPYPGGNAWTAPGYGLVQPAAGGSRVIVTPDGNVLVEVTETPPPYAPPTMQQQPSQQQPQEKSSGMLVLAILAALFLS